MVHGDMAAEAAGVFCWACSASADLSPSGCQQLCMRTPGWCLLAKLCALITCAMSGICSRPGTGLEERRVHTTGVCPTRWQFGLRTHYWCCGLFLLLEALGKAQSGLGLSSATVFPTSALWSLSVGNSPPHP